MYKHFRQKNKIPVTLKETKLVKKLFQHKLSSSKIGDSFCLSPICLCLTPNSLANPQLFMPVLQLFMSVPLKVSWYGVGRSSDAVPSWLDGQSGRMNVIDLHY